MARPKLIVFASGTKDAGGSGFENLVTSPDLDAEIVAVVSNHERGGVRARAERLGVRFIHMPAPYDATAYQNILADAGAEWAALSGWLKFAHGLDPRKTFNIHPAPLSFDNGRFGGAGLYGHRVHEAVKTALDAGEISESGVTMHFTTEEYDRGPIFFEYRVSLAKGMTSGQIAQTVNVIEHRFQSQITNMVIHGEIFWDGEDPSTMRMPPGYSYFPKQ